MKFSQEKRLKREDELSKEYGFTRNFIKEKKNFFMLFGSNLKENYEDNLLSLLINLKEKANIAYEKLLEDQNENSNL